MSVSGACAGPVPVFSGVAGELVLKFVLLDEEEYVCDEKDAGEGEKTDTNCLRHCGLCIDES